MAEDVRKDVWPFLLKVFEWDSTTKDRIRVKREKTFVDFLLLWILLLLKLTVFVFGETGSSMRD